MAGGGGSMQVERSKRGKAGKRKKKKRIGFRLDMTPLVDITFLLLTFFMFTTTMATPQVMDMSLPPEREREVKVDCNFLFNIMVRKDSRVFWQLGCDTTKFDEVKITDLQKLVEGKNIEKDKQNLLLTVLKISDDASYETAIKILDILNLAEYNITQVIEKEKDANGKPLKNRRRIFSLLPMSEWDASKIEGLGK